MLLVSREMGPIFAHRDLNHQALMDFKNHPPQGPQFRVFKVFNIMSFKFLMVQVVCILATCPDMHRSQCSCSKEGELTSSAPEIVCLVSCKSLTTSSLICADCLGTNDIVSSELSQQALSVHKQTNVLVIKFDLKELSQIWYVCIEGYQ